MESQRPHVIMADAMSLDGSSTGFDLDIAYFYRCASGLGGDAVLAGSKTLETGIRQFLTSLPPERKEDFLPPEGPGRTTLPYLFVPDSTGRLEGLLHVMRQEPYYRDVVVFCTPSTPASYRTYLAERNYAVYETEGNKVNLTQMLSICRGQYGVTRMVTDSGGELVGALLDAGIVDELAILLCPHIVGLSRMPLFRAVSCATSWELMSAEPGDSGTVWLRYRLCHRNVQE
jgi:2,5-diamino-6-(ribosylamino)-4(3H)-pyrimidinone 5'-phosphate reductase